MWYQVYPVRDLLAAPYCSLQRIWAAQRLDQSVVALKSDFVSIRMTWRIKVGSETLYSFALPRHNPYLTCTLDSLRTPLMCLCDDKQRSPQPNLRSANESASIPVSVFCEQFVIRTIESVQ